VSQIQSECTRLRSALESVAAMKFPADRPGENAANIATMMGWISSMFLDLRDALIKEGDDNGADFSTWTESREAGEQALYSGFETALEVMSGERADLAAATRAEQRWELGAGK